VNMKVDLTEKTTGSFSAGIGYSQLEKVTFTGSVKEENAFGKGYVANLDFSLGRLTRNYNVSLTDPYFMSEKISASVNLYKRQTDLQDITNYITDSDGASLGFGIPVTEHISYGINYQFDRTKLQVVDLATVSLLLQSQLGKQTTGELTQALSWDTRNRVMADNEGHLEQLKVTVAGRGWQ